MASAWREICQYAQVHGYHPERPRQAGGTGLYEPHEIQQGHMQRLALEIEKSLQLVQTLLKRSFGVCRQQDEPGPGVCLDSKGQGCISLGCINQGLTTGSREVITFASQHSLACI